jgi:hypothetical protein
MSLPARQTPDPFRHFLEVPPYAIANSCRVSRAESRKSVFAKQPIGIGGLWELDLYLLAWRERHKPRLA